MTAPNSRNFNNFRAFNGLLDRHILVCNDDDDGAPHTIVGLRRDRGMYDRFIEAMRANPQAGGIADKRAQEVKALLNFFFPFKGQGQRSEPRLGAVAQSNGVPISVQAVRVSLGPDNAPLLIADAAGALAHLFNLEAEQRGYPDSLDYIVPMAFLFRRIIYLAFITWKGESTSAKQALKDCVPVMGCVMFAPQGPGERGPFRYSFGVTVTHRADCDKASIARSFTVGKLMDVFRLDNILHPALNSMNPQMANRALNPFFDDEFAKSFAIILWKDLVGAGLEPSVRGRLFNQRTVTDATVRLERESIAEYRNLGGERIVKLKYEHMLKVPELENRITENLSRMLRASIHPTYVTSNSVATASSRNILELLFLPVFCVADEHGEPNFESLLTEFHNSTSVENVMQKLRQHVQPLKRRLVEVLGRFGHPSSPYPLPPTPFGRCAETYPFAIMSPQYYHADPSSVGGLAFNIRSMGNTRAFQHEFSTTTMRNAAGTLSDGRLMSLWRLPCERCDITTDGVFFTNYDKTIHNMPGVPK